MSPHLCTTVHRPAFRDSTELVEVQPLAGKTIRRGANARTTDAAVSESLRGLISWADCGHSRHRYRPWYENDQYRQNDDEQDRKRDVPPM